MNVDFLWVTWICQYLIKWRSFWDAKFRADCSWCWRKIVQMRAQFKQFVCYHDGASFCSSMILGFQPRGCFPHCQIVGVGSLVCLWLQNWAACFVVANGVGSGICVPKHSILNSLLKEAPPFASWFGWIGWALGRDWVIGKSLRDRLVWILPASATDQEPYFLLLCCHWRDLEKKTRLLKFGQPIDWVLASQITAFCTIHAYDYLWNCVHCQLT